MSKYCKDCKHGQEESEINTGMFTVGLLLLHVPLFINEDKIECRNVESTFYGDNMDEYDTCIKFEEK
jgi:hypothetical protein